jgi:hypothetical protein
MKNIIYLLTIAMAITFVGCNPLEDLYDDIDARDTPGVDFIQADEQYTFVTEDYELYEDELEGEEFFMSQDQADLLIPDFLAETFPVWGEGSLVNVTYNLFDETVPVTMVTSETLSNINDIDGFLSSNMEAAVDGTFVALTYNAEVLAYTLSDNDFETIEDALGSKYPEATSSAARFGNFERRSSRDSFWSDDMIVEAITVLLADDFNTGQVVAVSFAIFDGSPGSESFTVQHNGFNFLKLDVDASGADAIEYTLTGEDYNTIATGLMDVYPNPAENLGRFGSFDTRVGSSDNAWSDEMIIEGLNLVLPTAMEGDVYVVSYEIFNGSRGTDTITLLFTGGAYIENATVVEVTAVVAKNDGDWEFPYTFTRANFDTFGFRFPNFSSSNVFILDIFLEDLFPFAQAGDVATVQYDFFAGGTSTKYGKSVFDGNKWNLTPDVIETAFQYGFEDGVWLPDNTINYMLTDSDITLISNAFIDIYPGPADNVGFFGSFDRRSGSSTFWNDDMLLEAFNVLLDARDSGAEEGQKYALTYIVFTGSTGTETQSVIKTNGVWVYQ